MARLSWYQYSPLNFQSWFQVLVPDLYAILCKQIGYEETEEDWKYYEGAKDKSLRRFAAEADATIQRNLNTPLKRRTIPIPEESTYMSQSTSRVDIFQEMGIPTVAEAENENSADVSFTSTHHSKLNIDVDSMSNTSTVIRNGNFNKTFSNIPLSLTPQRTVKEKLNQLLVSPMPSNRPNKIHTFFASTPLKQTVPESFSPAVPLLVKQLDNYNESVRCMLAEGMGSVYYL